MKEDIRFAVALSALGNPGDRFMSGYKQDRSAEEMFALAAEAGIEGLEFVYDRDISKGNVNQVKEYLDKYKMKCCDVLPNLFGRQEYIRGSISSGRSEVVEQAKAEIRDVIEITKKIGGRGRTASITPSKWIT